MAGATLSVAAAPTINESPVQPESGAVLRSPAGGEHVDISSGADAPGSSRTIRMLLDLQSTPERSDDAASASQGTATRPKPALNAQPSPASPRAEQQQRPGDPQGVDWINGMPAGGIGGPLNTSRGANAANYRQPGFTTDPSGARSAAPESGGDGRSLLPREWIQFLRENRDWVLGGSVALLALLGAGASFNSQRRR